MSGRLPPEASVIVAARGRPETAGEALASLGQQSLATSASEVVVVVNGPPDGTREAADEVARRQPHAQVRVLHSSRPGGAHARTVGLWAARGTYKTIPDPGAGDRLVAAVRGRLESPL